MTIFKDIIGFLNTLTFIDFIFFFSVVLLIILIVSLIYFIKINDDVFEKTLKGSNIDEEIKKIEDKKDLLDKIEVEPPMIFDENEEGELLDLEALTKKLEENKGMNVDLTAYEKEQEERAIISYEELLSKTSNSKINYEEEEVIDDITIKKVDLANLISEVEETNQAVNVQVISYNHEEAFLQALKQLQQNLN